ncbi:hypothetical protein DFQ28_001138 [Apophysomyces sp. BC1034]|nr:hypothetical protein DFQ28_001138 [Apophysomyces sp. BC1034]
MRIPSLGPIRIVSAFRKEGVQKEIDNNGAIPQKEQGVHLRNLLSFSAGKNNGANYGFRERQTQSNISNVPRKDIFDGGKSINNIWPTKFINGHLKKYTIRALEKEFEGAMKSYEDLQNKILELHSSAASQLGAVMKKQGCVTQLYLSEDERKTSLKNIPQLNMLKADFEDECKEIKDLIQLLKNPPPNMNSARGAETVSENDADMIRAKIDDMKLSIEFRKSMNGRRALSKVALTPYASWPLAR